MMYYRISKNEKNLFFGEKNRPGVGSDLKMIDNTALVKSSHFNTIGFHGVIGNILTLGVRAPGLNPGESTKLGSWELILRNQL